MKILVINCGSSSIKYKVFEMPEERLVARGMVEKIGEEISCVTYQRGTESVELNQPVKNHEEGLAFITRFLVDPKKGVVADVAEIGGVGHRVVHGGEGFDRAVAIDDGVYQKIEEYKELAPLHNPHNLSGIRAARKFFPESLQVAAFDTAFHTTIPEVAYLYAIPRSFYDRHHIRRYGFHGTSHRYVARRAAKLMGKDKYGINVITCHLGNGCSIAAVRNGHSVDTSMGFTPLEGLIMGTRSGDIDPGVIFHLMERFGMDAKKVNSLLNKESGLLGISGVSNDFRNLIGKAEQNDRNAALAIEMFCYRIKKYIGSYMAVLGRTDAIVFTGGIGEHRFLAREKSLAGMEPLGIVLDDGRNKETVEKEGEISAAGSAIKIFVIPTDEEFQIAFDTYEFSCDTKTATARTTSS